jgi:hypothetical protein
MSDSISTIDDVEGEIDVRETWLAEQARLLLLEDGAE